MPETRSINQNLSLKLLPDFRNLGTVLRIVLLANGLALLGIVAQAATPQALFDAILQGSVIFQPALLASLLGLYLLNSLLQSLSYWQAAVLVAIAAVTVTVVLDAINSALLYGAFDNGPFQHLQHEFVAVAMSLVLLAYFRLRIHALSPSVQGARLQALQARIRPHFLFNSINAVLSIVRSDPKRAETALEDMADLFRTAMSDPQEMVLLSKEIALAQQYLGLETLRLEDRLQVKWEMDGLPPDVLIPPLILQPLLENAVYHGIEPSIEGGEIVVKLFVSGDEVHLVVRNPISSKGSRREGGNHMALSNIRERLALLFDVEAQYQVEHDDGHYQVYIRIPYVKGQMA